MRKKIVMLVVVILLALAVCFFYIYKAPMAKNIVWGAAFSQKHAVDMGLDWKETYSALLDDLKVKNIKLAAHWDIVEPRNGVYDFFDLDWQMDEAAKRGVKVMLAIGMKTPRWPECHVPIWAEGLGKNQQQEAIVAMLKAVVGRYQNHPALASWQVENEPLFAFGNCPWKDENFLKKEAALTRALDATRKPVVISDSGEGSWWWRAAAIGDVVAITMYRRVYFREIKTYITYPISPAFYAAKAKIVDLIFKKPVICGELQAEPWAANQFYDGGKNDAKTMDVEQFRDNIAFAKSTGLDAFYLWGGEWWYWMKQKHDRPEFWEEAKTLFE